MWSFESKREQDGTVTLTGSWEQEGQEPISVRVSTVADDIDPEVVKARKDRGKYEERPVYDEKGVIVEFVKVENHEKDMLTQIDEIKLQFNAARDQEIERRKQMEIDSQEAARIDELVSKLQQEMNR